VAKRVFSTLGEVAIFVDSGGSWNVGYGLLICAVLNSSVAMSRPTVCLRKYR
jgi:hypothetical protein